MPSPLSVLTLALLFATPLTHARVLRDFVRPGTNRSANSPALSLAFPVENSRNRHNIRRGSRPAYAPPADDSDPPGVRIYDSLDAVPTARLLAQAARHKKCFSKGQTLCWAPYVCGHRCEQILLAVDGYCKKYAQPPDGTECTDKQGSCALSLSWKRCKKARKFNRCFARVCYRRTAALRHHQHQSLAIPRPVSYEDTENVAIVRYRRPLPKHEILARRNRQSSTQSAIFK
ncbi:unnamed protein product [Chondrus crispus]|uniref:Uncharacterized protein n=1 Tax=Chondrus crispus TaxID=2769 RepID=R7Q596_CHOCR|nr:unnamed protein product [Chondrus crispus]CDF33727.1 unnamed protein product [Chondrus crispus]|eukprot:XP_005713546.1 unnamed protein product [Chondrus crispus]